MQDMALAAIAVDRASFEFRRARPVVIAEDGRPVLLAAAAEALGADVLARLRATGPVRLALTAQRALALKVGTAGTDPVLIPAGTLSAEDLAAIPDPTLDLARPLQGPFTALREAPRAAHKAAVALAKVAQLLPASVLVELPAGAGIDGLVTADAAAILSQPRAIALTVRPLVSARVPLAPAPDTRFVAFRPADASIDHIAIVVGNPIAGGAKPPLVRLHSECFTGDLLGSLRCDCGDQLRGAIASMQAEGAGILLYLAQEGRGIGIVNKLRAYRLQDQGFDTVEANLRLGFEADERGFLVAAEMLRHLGFTRVRLLTNNPDKVAQLETCGIEVAERVAHAFPANNHNEAYLAAKKKRSGHLL
jgi:GTP cyclohydrolase II